MSARARFRDRIEEARRLHVDARVLAYHLLARPKGYAELTRLLFAGLTSGAVRAQSSSLSLFQLLSEPYRRGMGEEAERAARYLSAFPGLRLVPVTDAVARQAAEVRANLGGGVELAVQIATALAGDADQFLTEGSGLRRIAGVEVLNLEDFLPGSGDHEE